MVDLSVAWELCCHFCIIIILWFQFWGKFIYLWTVTMWFAFFDTFHFLQNAPKRYLIACPWGQKLIYPDSIVHAANMGPTWLLSAPDGPHVGPMNLAIRVLLSTSVIALLSMISLYNELYYNELNTRFTCNILLQCICFANCMYL